MSTKTVSKGPIYGVPLIGSLPLSGGMSQAMPSRADLLNVQRVAAGGERTVAGYEVLLNSQQELLAACRSLREAALNMRGEFVVTGDITAKTLEPMFVADDLAQAAIAKAEGA